MIFAITTKIFLNQTGKENNMTERIGGTKRSALSMSSASLKKTREKGKAISYSDRKQF